MIIYANQINPDSPSDTDRSYLNEFFADQRCLLISEFNMNFIKDLHDYICQAGDIDRIVIDLTHNPFDLYKYRMPVKYQGADIGKINDLLCLCLKHVPTTILHTDHEFVAPSDHYRFFPLWPWMWSGKTPLWFPQINWGDGVFSPKEKTQAMCCLNRTPHFHRILLFNKIIHRPWFSQIAYTFGNHGHGKQYHHAYDKMTQDEIQEFQNNLYHLPKTVVDQDREDTTDTGIDHPVYRRCAFNLVTESTMGRILVSEKSCKPFFARQIPIIIGPRGTTKFFQDNGLDMFADIIPWHTWDSEPDARIRLDKTVEFLDDFLSQDPVKIYHANTCRVDYNHDYFQSTEFRQRIMQEMNYSNFEPA